MWRRAEHTIPHCRYTAILWKGQNPHHRELQVALRPGVRMCWAVPKVLNLPLRSLHRSTQRKLRCRQGRIGHPQRAVHKNYPRVAELPETRKAPKDFVQPGHQPQHFQRVSRSPNLKARECLERP